MMKLYSQAADNQGPFSLPDDVQEQIDDTHPDTDTDLDLHEQYDAGRTSAADFDTGIARSAVVDYDPITGRPKKK